MTFSVLGQRGQSFPTGTKRQLGGRWPPTACPSLAPGRAFRHGPAHGAQQRLFPGHVVAASGRSGMGARFNRSQDDESAHETKLGPNVILSVKNLSDLRWGTATVMRNE